VGDFKFVAGFSSTSKTFLFVVLLVAGVCVYCPVGSGNCAVRANTENLIFQPSASIFNEASLLTQSALEILNPQI
jgi:hypothetical protein